MNGKKEVVPVIKAYVVEERISYEHQKIVFAETATQAKNIAYGCEPFEDFNYIELYASRAKYADGHENDSERDLTIHLIRNGWFFESGGELIDSDNLEQAIAENWI
ncbi:hypothetical protein ACFSY7_15280 [Kurthia populi]|uniref:Uncharacterized protein n=1 Tax=Kurthia populi TaxID=1562132 RepID=A0ABW5Y4E4_9BACL